MKNIHIIPTNKPSRLAKHSSGSFHIVSYIAHKKGLYKMTNQHIYITNDEEIKGGDWCLDKFNQRWKLEDKKLIGFDNKGIKRFSTDNILGHECKKIILTTDPDLIKDGVQAIDDEFLEWFVKNPSCERVEVRKEYNEERIVKGKDIGDYNYKIIIPQEEFTIIKGGNDIAFPSSTTITFKPLPDVNWESDITNKVWDEDEPKQIKCYCGHTITCDCEPLQETTGKEFYESADKVITVKKQETLEEAAKQSDKSKCKHFRREHTKEEVYDSFEEGFIKGAKWQQERMYSEEDMLRFAQKYSVNKLDKSHIQQYKKKFG
jgi:hypothetical protein